MVVESATEATKEWEFLLVLMLLQDLMKVLIQLLKRRRIEFQEETKRSSKEKLKFKNVEEKETQRRFRRDNLELAWKIWNNW